MKYAEEIKDEEKGARHYKTLAKKETPKHSRTFSGMAHEELEHKGKLQHMAKSRAITKKSDTGR